MRKLLLGLMIGLLVFISFPQETWAEWHQDAHDAQRTGYTGEEPEEPWQLVWMWNGSDSSGGASCPNNDPTQGHCYDIGTGYTGGAYGGTTRMWEGRTVSGGNYIYVPALGRGLYALKKTVGNTNKRAEVAWNFNPGGTSMKATPAYDPQTGYVFVGAENGRLYKINSQYGSLAGTYNAGSPLNKSVLLAGGFVYVVGNNGSLHKVRISDMTSVWVYQANAQIATPPAYSSTRDVIVYATNDLYVHAVNSDGSSKWKRKPTTHNPGSPYEFDGYWPVIAENHGVVFVRMRLDFNTIYANYSSLDTNQKWRTYLENTPARKSLFALDLDSGFDAFTPAVGYTSVEAYENGALRPEMGPVPVIKVLGDGKEVAYQVFRSTIDPSGSHPARDGHVGEMVLDNSTTGLNAGDLRFIKWYAVNVSGGTGFHLSDAVCPLSMAGNTIFHSGWGAFTGVQIKDRSATKGLSFSNPITVKKQPTIIRRCAGYGCSLGSEHLANGSGFSLYNDGTPYFGTGNGNLNSFWTYYQAMDPPTPVRGAYSEGILPRYAYVTSGLVVVQGNGGELMVFEHSGSSLPTPTSPPTPSFSKGDVNHDGQVNVEDAVQVLVDWLSEGGSIRPWSDANSDSKVNGLDFGYVLSDWGS